MTYRRRGASAEVCAAFVALSALALPASAMPDKKLLKDLNTVTLSSTLRPLHVVGTKALFVDTDPATGTEVWVSDGTPAGTHVLKDLSPGTASTLLNDASFKLRDGLAYFCADPSGPDNNHVYGTDGTESGTFDATPVHGDGESIDIAVLQRQCEYAWAGDTLFFGGQYLAPRTITLRFGLFGLRDGKVTWLLKLPDLLNGNLRDFVPVGDRLLFQADDGVHGWRTYASDGSAAGTVLLPLGPEYPLPLGVLSNGLYYLRAGDADHGYEMWRTDGTVEGTFMLVDMNPGPDSDELLSWKATGNLFYWMSRGPAPDHRWRLVATDGTVDGTRVVYDALPTAPAWIGPDLHAIGDVLVFTAPSATSSSALWRSDGTPEGTFPFYDGLLYCSDFVAAQSLICSQFNGPSDMSLWRTDGTTAGTQWLAPAESAAGFGSAGPDRVFFSAVDADHGREPWVTDGTTAGTEMLADVKAGPDDSVVSLFSGGDGVAFFWADDYWHGLEIWFSDGSPEGTHLAADLDRDGASSNPSDFAAIGERAVFVAEDPTLGRVAWGTDGTPDGTEILASVKPNVVAGVPTFTLLQDALLFPSGDIQHATLWRTDGTAAATSLVHTFDEPTASYFMTPWNGAVYFLRNMTELWSSDGTPDGTMKVQSLPLILSKDLQAMVATTDHLIVTEANANWGGHIVVSDGTAGGTPSDFPLPTGAGIVQWTPLAAAGRFAYFVAKDADHGQELWRTDGTPEGTLRVTDIAPGPLSSQPMPTGRFGDRLVFRAMDASGHGSTWITDGTPEGTTSICPIAAVSPVETLAGVGYFIAQEYGSPSATRNQLWRTDGTVEGTRRVGTVLPTLLLGEKDGVLLFNASVIGYPTELWRTDGTDAGTYRLKGVFASDRGNEDWVPDNEGLLAMTPSAILMAGYDKQHGAEPWIAPFCPVLHPSSADFDHDGRVDDCEVGPALADIDLSGKVDGFDLARLGRAFGTSCGDALYDAGADLDRSCAVDGQDLAILATSFGMPAPWP